MTASSSGAEPRSEGEKDDRTKADASPATQEADGSNTPAVNETEAPKSENTAGDAAPKQETTAAGERKEGTPQQEPTEEEAEEKVTPEQKPTEEEAEEKATPQPAKAKAEAPKAAQEPSAEQEEQKEQEEEEDKEDEPTVPSDPCSTGRQQQHKHPRSADHKRHYHCQQLCQRCQEGFFVVLDNVNIDRSKDYSDNNKAALTVKGNGDTEIETGRRQHPEGWLQARRS